MWEVEVTDEFSDWFDSLEDKLQNTIARGIQTLRRMGPMLGRPLVDTLKGSRHSNMKELRAKYRGEPYRVLFAFDPRRTALLLIGGCKTGDKRFYQRLIPIADELFDAYLAELRKEGLI